MASHQHLLQDTKPRFDSPAKVFAKLKSKVQMARADGFYTGKGPLCHVRDKHGDNFKRAESTWMTDELKENQRSSSYRHEVQALTLSPISSPQKNFGYSYSDLNSKPVEVMPPVTDTGCTPRNGAFLQSTAVSQPLCLVNKEQIHTQPPQTRDLDGFKVTSRTPVKIQPVEKDRVRSAPEEDCVPLHRLISPVCMFSPMRKRLRKRKLESQEFANGSSSTKEVSREVISEPKERKYSSAFSKEDTDNNNTCVENLGDVRGFSSDRTEIEPTLPPRSTALKRCLVTVGKIPPMSPAKMFAYMKERESKMEQQKLHEVSSSTRDFFDGGESRDSPPSTARDMSVMEDIAFGRAPESVVPFNRSRADSANSQSDTDPRDDFLVPAPLPPQPVLLEDPLVLRSPRVSIPKKHEAVFKRNKWPQPAKFPSESVIYLKKWFLRKNHKGLFLDGIHREDNIPWNSNIVVDRVSNFVLKTVSGRVYILVGKMNLDVDSGFPKWFLKKFANGFPPNWKALYERFLSESRDDSGRETERNSEGTAKTKSEASSINLSVKRHRKKPLKTPESCPPAPASASSTKVSRSGRIIKPPLEYWKGGRVILDAHMNVTIHECYETSICVPEVTTTVSARASQKPAHLFLPQSDGKDNGEAVVFSVVRSEADADDLSSVFPGHEQCESASDKEASVLLRRVKAPLRKFRRPPVETASSPDKWSGRRMRSSQRCPATERTVCVDADPQKQSGPENCSTWRSKRQTKPSARVSRSKQAASASPESPSINGETAQHQSSGGELSFRRKKREKGAHGRRGRKVLSLSSESSEESEKKKITVAKNSKAAQTQMKHKQSKCAKISPPTKPLPKSTQTRKKRKANTGTTLTPHEQDEDEWTEAELVKLQEAVSFYPKHMAGYWANVARMVGTRSTEECYNRHTSPETSQTPAKKPMKPKKQKMEAPKAPEIPVISARVGTLKRKQQVRQFLEAMPREDVDDVFSSEYMQNKRFEMPSMCPSDDNDFTLSELEPLSPMSTGFPEVKTPQCLHITPSMMGSPNRSNDDKYVYQLQKRLKRNQFNVCKQAPSSKSFTPTPSVKRAMRRCGNTENDTFVVWEMFPGNDGALSDSGEEEDFYFSDND